MRALFVCLSLSSWVVFGAGNGDAIIEACGANCSPLSLVAGHETVFHLSFKPNHGAGGVVLGDSSVVTTTLIHHDRRSDLSIRAHAPGKSSITIQRENGEVAAHFDIVVTE